MRPALVDDPEEGMLDGAPDEGAQGHELAVDAVQDRLQIVAHARVLRDRYSSNFNMKCTPGTNPSTHSVDHGRHLRLLIFAETLRGQTSLPIHRQCLESGAHFSVNPECISR